MRCAANGCTKYLQKPHNWSEWAYWVGLGRLHKGRGVTLRKEMGWERKAVIIVVRECRGSWGAVKARQRAIGWGGGVHHAVVSLWRKRKRRRRGREKTRQACLAHHTSSFHLSLLHQSPRTGDVKLLHKHWKPTHQAITPITPQLRQENTGPH